MSTKRNVTKSSVTSKHLVSSSSKSTDKKDATKKEDSRSKIQAKKKEEEEKHKSIPPSRKKISTTRNSPQIKKSVVSSNKTPRSKASERPTTPPSSRVTKTQYFPSKKIYSNALKDEAGKLKSSPTKAVQNKENYNESSSEASSLSERPRTATLRKGSIVNKNIVGPEAPPIKLPVTVPIESPKKPPEEEYEDDFDSYESDFEAESSDSTTNLNVSEISTGSSSTESEPTEALPKRVNSASTDDEKKLDSGNYELPEYRHKQILDEIKEVVHGDKNESKINLGSLSDEGFEEAKSLQFINFLGAHQRYKHRKSIEKKRKRGEEILSMIRLDHYNFTLLDLPPVPYEQFILNYGKSNSVQASVQTGEDNLDEEIQTETISQENKWTQFPTKFTKLEENELFWENYRCYYLGVGGDNIKVTRNITTNNNNLEKFLKNAGTLVLNIQAEESAPTAQEFNKSNIPFSKECITFNTFSQECLKKRKMKSVCFCANSNQFLTTHGSNGTEVVDSIICRWNICNTTTPEEMLTTYGEITSCDVSTDLPNLIFCGLENGSIALWDTKESLSYHQILDLNEAAETFQRLPTYITEIKHGHSSKIVSLQSIKKISSWSNDIFTKSNVAEICSLDEDGEIIIWSVIIKEESSKLIIENQGLAHWGSVIVLPSVKISLSKQHPEIPDFRCTDLGINQLDPQHLYISTNYGVVIHCLSNGSKQTIKKFMPNTQSQANCIETCPFSPLYLMVGSDNGDISFYSQTIEKPLMVMSNKDSVKRNEKIEMLQWSFTRPLIFYTKDNSNTLHVWNLKVSDMFPTYSIPFKDEIVGLKLSPIIEQSENVYQKTYMLIGTNKGLVYVHLLNEEHGRQAIGEFESDKRKLFDYINRHS